MSNEPRGCLVVLFELLGIPFPRGGRGRDAMPYRLRDDFLSAAERSFHGVLQSAVGENFAICCKVNLGDLFFVPRAEGSQAYRNKIDRKHVDFLLCRPEDMQPLCGIELDDRSHRRRDRRERDAFVDGVFDVAGLPLLRFPASTSYSPREIRQRVELTLGSRTLPMASREDTGDDPPWCGKCDVPMVPRKASRGRNAGRSFWGCPNYPKCREVVRA